MNLDLKQGLKSILESESGVHLTAYITNRKDLRDLQYQIERTVREANCWLEPIMDSEERKKFLDPIAKLNENPRILEMMKDSIGIFRTQNVFRMLNLPIEIDFQCHVANTFHIKPVLKWLQFDYKFFVLGFTDSNLTIYSGTQTSLKKVSERFFHKDPPTTSDIKFWIQENFHSLNSASKIYIISQKPLPRFLKKKFIGEKKDFKHLKLDFTEDALETIIKNIRISQKEEARHNLDQALKEFDTAFKLNLAKKNIFQIAKAAIQGKVKKLLIADGINIYGKLDAKTGGIALHALDLDHEDDDILDDIAQKVLASGGEVILAPYNEIPDRRPILALIDEEIPLIKSFKYGESKLILGDA